MYAHQQPVALAIVKAIALQDNVHVKKWDYFVQQNVIQNVTVVLIWINRLKYLDS